MFKFRFRGWSKIKFSPDVQVQILFRASIRTDLLYMVSMHERKEIRSKVFGMKKNIQTLLDCLKKSSIISNLQKNEISFFFLKIKTAFMGLSYICPIATMTT
jgi:hypothetical protein